MRISRFLLPVAAFLGVLAVIGLGVLAWNQHRERQLAEVWRLLDDGARRLERADVPGARQQFGAAADGMRALGRDPLMPLHHLMAADLQAGGAPADRIQVFSLPTPHEGETVLDLALSEDGSLAAVATTRRLLCISVHHAQWTGAWSLPQRIGQSAALHVDANGRAHLLIADDGAWVSAECRTPGSDLIVNPRATGSRPVVGWFDPEERRVWIAPARPNGADLELIAQPFPGGLDESEPAPPAVGERSASQPASAEPFQMSIAFPGEPNTLFPDAAVVHAIARIGGQVLLFYGDAETTRDTDLRDESVLVVSIDDPKRTTNRLVFTAHPEKGDGDTKQWQSQQVLRFLPASVPGRIYVLTGTPHGVTVLGANAKPLAVHADALFATEHRDGNEIYDLSVKGIERRVVVDLHHRGTGARLTYELPHTLEQAPAFGAISPDGRTVMVADAAGTVLMVNVSGQR